MIFFLRKLFYAELLLNIHLYENYAASSRWLTSTSDSKLLKSHSLIIRDDPKDLRLNLNESESSAVVITENSYLDQSKVIKPDEIDEEEGKIEFEYDYEVIESDFQKALEQRRKWKDEVKIYKEMYCLSDIENPKHPNFLYTDDPNEDEIFWKDVHTDMQYIFLFKMTIFLK